MRTTARQTRDNRTITVDFQNEATCNFAGIVAVIFALWFA
jgi:hypothetical protein